MRILWIVAISVSWQFSDAYFFMPKFLCIPPFVAINGSCLIPTTTKPLIPPCSKNPQNSTVLPENPEIVTVTPPDLLPEDGDSIGENIAKDKEPSLPIKVPAVPSENEVSTESSVNTSSPAPDDTIISNPEIIPPSKHVNSSEILTNPGQETDGSQHPGKGTTLKPIVPDANKVSTESSANTTNLDPNDNIIKKPEVSDQNISGGSVGGLPITPSIPDTDEIASGISPGIPLPGITEVGSETHPIVPTHPTDNLMPKIIEPQIPIPKLIRPEDLYPKYTNIQPLLPKDIKPYNFTGV
ncbi:uncharacterized protein Dere_GG22141 [Drosophila erecta]|uniref:Uncharacterized protein n=1 Tax=Drosophila erecta TaxID=7220 RepID=A0A0Q5VLI7_DROER|nr:uncharacterized protein Dere_GG22141 [Drosophila erecta]